MAASRWKEIEKQEGKPMREILVGLYERFGDAPNTQELIAESLGVSQPTVSQWVKILNLAPKTTLVPSGGN